MRSSINEAISARIAALPSYILYGLTSIFILFTVGFWYITIYSYFAEKITHTSAALMGLYAHEDSQQERDNLLAKRSTSLADMQNQLQNYQSPISHAHQIQETLDFLYASAQENKIDFNSCHINLAKKKDWADVYHFNMHVKGNLKQLQSFFEKLKTAHVCFSCKAMHLIKEQEKYCLNITLATYFVDSSKILSQQ